MPSRQEISSACPSKNSSTATPPMMDVTEATWTMLSSGSSTMVASTPKPIIRTPASTASMEPAIQPRYIIENEIKAANISTLFTEPLNLSNVFV